MIIQVLAQTYHASRDSLYYIIQIMEEEVPEGLIRSQGSQNKELEDNNRTEKHVTFDVSEENNEQSKDYVEQRQQVTEYEEKQKVEGNTNKEISQLSRLIEAALKMEQQQKQEPKESFQQTRQCGTVLYALIQQNPPKEAQDFQTLAGRLSLIVKIQPALKVWSRWAGKAKRRYFCLQELVKTQQGYLSDLRLIKQRIQIPLRLCNAISEEQQKQMFPDIDSMINLSSQIAADMEKCLLEWNRRITLIGPQMIMYSRFLLLYSSFFKNYQTTSRKLKLLVQNNQQVKEIQKFLSAQCSNKTFQDLMSKPFQRPMKYRLVLVQYSKQTPQDHPDYENIQKAIQCYHEVNQHNNRAMENKEKNQILMHLEGTFGDIIGSGARYFISQSQAFVFEQKVKCYILSDIIFVSRIDGQRETEYARIEINQYSFVSALKNGICMKNQLLLCGKHVCIHLIFEKSQERDRFSTYVSGAIQDLYNSQNFKEAVRNTRRSSIPSTLSILVKDAEENRISFLRGTYQQESFLHPPQRISMTQTKNKILRPPRIIVLGPIKRAYSSKVSKKYFLTKFQMPFPSDFHQVLYINQQQLLMIKRMVRILYFYERKLFTGPCMAQLAYLMQSKQQLRGNEYTSLYYTLFLNTVFRHPQTNKRLDIFSLKMGVAEGLWLYLRYGSTFCECQHCRKGAIINTIEEYNRQLEARKQAKTKQQNPFYCPLRTLHVQDSILTMDPRQILHGIDRLFWIKTEKGCLDYRLLNNYQTMQARKQVFFQISHGVIQIKYPLVIYRQQRVGQIKHYLSRNLYSDLTEYCISMQINNVTYLLGDDQILYDIVANEQPPETGFSGFFKNAFGSQQDTTIRLYVRRLWWFVHREADISYCMALDIRIRMFMESMISRIKLQEIQLNIKDTITFYACYLIYKDEKEVTQNMLEDMVPTKKWKLLNSNVKNDMRKNVQNKFEKLVQDFNSVEGDNMKVKVFKFVMKVLRDRPIWGVFFFEGTCDLQGKSIPVRIGFDMARFFIKEHDKVTNIFECKLSQLNQKVLITSWQVRIKTQSESYVVTGSQFMQMMTILELYISFSKTYTPLA